MKETINGILTNNSIVAINNGDGWHVSHPYYIYVRPMLYMHPQSKPYSYTPNEKLRSGEVKYLALGHKNFQS